MLYSLSRGIKEILPSSIFHMNVPDRASRKLILKLPSDHASTGLKNSSQMTAAKVYSESEISAIRKYPSAPFVP